MVGARGSFHIPGSSRHLPPNKEFHAEHVSLEIKVDLDSKGISGVCRTRLVPAREGLTVLHLDAREMRIAGVTLDGAAAKFEHDGQTLTVSPVKLTKGVHELRVEYSANPRQGIYFVSPDEMKKDKPVQAWSQGEPEFTRYWMPCHDHPNDKATSEMLITVPQGYLAISNGRMLSRKDEGGWTTFHWREDVRHSMYLNSFVVGKFGVIEDKAGGVPLQYYFPESKREDAMRLFGQTPEMLSVFESLTRTKYPYEKYAQVAVHDFMIGGMENISATTLTDTRFPDQGSEEDYAARYSKPDRNHIELVAHELAHMWFGDLVTAKHWSHLWLNEGFATYYQALYTREKLGEDEFRHDMLAKAETYFEEDESSYRRAIVDDVYVYADDVFDSYAYEKASWMIHQLRFILGDELFFDATGEYLRRYAGENADTHDLMKVLEDKSGYSLEGYFDQAFYKAGHPEFEVSYAWDESSNTAELALRQVQQTDDLTPIFRLPCDIAFYEPGEDGRAGSRHVKRILVGSREEKFHFVLPWKPSIVEFDPEERLLKKIKFEKPISMLLSQLKDSVDASSRRRAAEALSSFIGEPGVVRALEITVKSEGQHYSVCSEAARSLGKLGTRDALTALLGLTHVKSRRVRRAVIAALGEFKDPAVARPLGSALKEDESPYVRCQAALSYGKARLPDAYDVITSAVGSPSPEEAITEACLDALGFLKDIRTRGFLRRYLPYGNATRPRVGALRGLSRLGWLEEEDVGTLKELLREDPEYTVRAQVLETASELLDKRFLGAVRESAEKDSDPRMRRRAMEVTLRLESASSVERSMGDIKEEVERVRAEGRELRERFSSLKLS
jgi:aminopeptidase N